MTLRFSVDFKGSGSSLIRLNSLNIGSNIYDHPFGHWITKPIVQGSKPLRASMVESAFQGGYNEFQKLLATSSMLAVVLF